MLSVFSDQVLCWLLVYHIIFIMLKYILSICFFGAFIIKWCWTLPKSFSRLLVWPCYVCVCSVWVHLRVLDCSCVWRSETDVRYCLLTSFHCISEGQSQSLTEPGLHLFNYSGWPTSHWALLFPPISLPAPNTQVAGCQAFHMGNENLNSGPHA